MKKILTEEDIKVKYITPAVEKSGWHKEDIFFEYNITAAFINK